MPQAYTSPAGVAVAERTEDANEGDSVFGKSGAPLAEDRRRAMRSRMDNDSSFLTSATGAVKPSAAVAASLMSSGA